MRSHEATPCYSTSSTAQKLLDGKSASARTQPSSSLFGLRTFNYLFSRGTQKISLSLTPTHSFNKKVNRISESSRTLCSEYYTMSTGEVLQLVSVHSGRVAAQLSRNELQQSSHDIAEEKSLRCISRPTVVKLQTQPEKHQLRSALNRLNSEIECL